jgi:hypothetical protein
MSLFVDQQPTAFDHPPLEGEGRTAKGSPGWGDSGATPAALLMLHRCHPHLARLRGPTSPQPKPRIRGFRPLNKVIEIGNSRFRLGEVKARAGDL